MNATALNRPCWSTTSFGVTTQPSPLETHALGDHLQTCRRPGGTWPVARLGAGSVLTFMTTRVVTSALLLGLPIVVAVLAW